MKILIQKKKKILEAAVIKFQKSYSLLRDMAKTYKNLVDGD